MTATTDDHERGPSVDVRMWRSAIGAAGPFALAVGLAVATWPVATIEPAPGLESSWQIALHMLAAGRAGGSRISFTYGPLGFLAVPVNVAPGTLLPSLMWVALVHLALAVTLLAVSRRSFGFVASGLVTAVLLSLSSVLGEAQALAAVAALGSAGRVGPRGRAWVAAGLGVLAGVSLTIKFNDGLVICALAIVCALGDRSGALGRLVGATTGMAAAATVSWVASGRPLSTLSPWLSDSVTMTTGYTAGMATEHSDALVDYVAAPYFVVAVLVFIVLRLRRVSPSTWIAWSVPALIFGFLTFKYAFVRHDLTHGSGLYVGLLLLVTLTPSLRQQRPLTLCAWALLAVAVVVMIEPRLTSTRRASLNPLTRASSAVEQFHDALNQETTLPTALQALRAGAGVPDAVVKAARAGAVHASPYDTAVIAAYGLDWRPLPVFQDYAAYVPKLDDLNSASLRSASGPDIVLWHDEARIDGHSPQAEPPRQFLTLLCGYRSSTEERGWVVLSRERWRCDEPRVLSHVRAVPGEAVDLPHVGDDEILVMRSSEPVSSVSARVRNLLFKPLTDPRVTVDGAAFTLPAPLLTQPVVVSVPGRLSWLPDAVPRHARSLTLDRIDSPVTVTFWALRFRPSTAGGQ